jgi:hypothetical protein
MSGEGTDADPFTASQDWGFEETAFRFSARRSSTIANVSRAQ